MRFQIMCRQDGETEYRDFFDADTIDDAREVAIRAAMRPGFTVYVYDVKLQERVMDFENEKYRR